MRSIVKTSKTVEEAIQLALTELNVSIDDVSVEVIDEPSKGFLGFIGAKDAKVRLTVDNDPIEIAHNFLKTVLDKMNIEAELSIKRDKEEIYVEVLGKYGRDMGVIIGKRGKTLDSLQYLVSLTVNKNRDKYLRVVLDTENYRKKREETLIRLAQKLANKAKATGKFVKLEPMNPFERRIIHAALQNDKYITTHSEGEEPYRKVVIEPK